MVRAFLTKVRTYLLFARAFLALTLSSILLVQPLYAQHRTDKRLEREIRALTDTFHGTAGVYVLNLRTGRE
ncbi:MAG TPA: hypothetical protein VN616_17460, partial [Puia sp.]|nr:hypothetical protein [Puia sp.]